MIENFSKVFIDTAPFVYILEYNKIFTPATEMVFSEFPENTVFITSVITYAEFCVKPITKKNSDAIKEFLSFAEDMNCDFKNVDISIAKIVAILRAKYKFLKTPDALQIATAIHYNCDKFITNDKKLKQISEIDVVLII